MTNFRAAVTKLRDSRGQSLVEFGLCSLLLIALLLAVVELSIMMVTYNTVVNAAREGERYAITHSSVPCGAGTCSAVTTSSVATIQTNTQTQVKTILFGAVARNATITVSFPDCSACTSPLPNPPTAANNTGPGYRVSVTVSYPYAPFLSYLSLPSFTMTSTSEGVITW